MSILYSDGSEVLITTKKKETRAIEEWFTKAKRRIEEWDRSEIKGTAVMITADARW